MKIFIFAGREHHKLKLQSVFNALAEKEYDVKWLICNNAINIDPPSEFIVPSGEPYLHAYDYLNQDSIEEINEIVGETDIPLPTLSAYISLFWNLYSLREAAELVIAFRNLLHEESPDAVLVLHSNNFFCKILLYQCQEIGIKTYCFQEGLLRDRDQETLNKQNTYAEYCDKIFAWSKSAKDALIEAGVSKRRISVVGMSHIDERWQIRNDPNRYQVLYKDMRKMFSLPEEAPIIYFAPPVSSEYQGDFVEDSHILSSVCRQLGAALIIRPHPTEINTLRSFVLELSQQYHVVRFDNRREPLDLLTVSNALITQHSTIALEALALNIPVFEINRSDKEILQSWAEQGVADLIRKDDEYTKISQLLSGVWQVDLNSVLAWIQENLAPLDGKATDRIVERIESAA